MTISIENLSPVPGVEITIIDRPEPVDTTGKRALLNAWRGHDLPVFPGQVLDKARHRHACEIFGDATY